MKRRIVAERKDGHPRLGEGLDQSLEHGLTVGATQFRIGQALRVWHHAQYRLVLVKDSGDPEL